VTTAVPLAEPESEELRQKLEKSLKKRIVLEKLVDKEILGGFVIRYGGMVADASLKTALEEISARMLYPKFGSELIHEN
jgi:F0F1-type ATP synthase delta subunit